MLNYISLRFECPTIESFFQTPNLTKYNKDPFGLVTKKDG